MSVKEAIEKVLEARRVMESPEVSEEIFVNPLDRRDGQIPSWSEIATEFKLTNLHRGQKKLFRTFYRAQRMFARDRRVKGRRLIKALDQLPHFRKFEDENADLLTSIAKKVRPKDR